MSPVRARRGGGVGTACCCCGSSCHREEEREGKMIGKIDNEQDKKKSDYVMLK